MRLRTRGLTLTLQSLALVLALSAYQTQAAAAPVIYGSYRVVDTADFGTEVRVTLDIHLSNPGDTGLFITKASFRESPRTGKSVEESVSVVLDPHGASSFTQQFTISKNEYERWLKGVRPRLSLGVQPTGGDETTVMVALMRQPGGRSE